LKPTGFSRAYNALPPSQPTSKPSLLSRFLPFISKNSQNVSSFRKIVALAKPERKSLGIAVSLLLVSSAISMSIPFTVGKLLDYFAGPNPVCSFFVFSPFIRRPYELQQIPYGLTIVQASGILFLIFTVGAFANTGRTILMRMSGQRIVARLREKTYVAAIKQEVEFVERGEGDVLSRLSVDSSIVGERLGFLSFGEEVV
jgi:ABC-type multidrug transport system fused ATPase/permease subunit